MKDDKTIQRIRKVRSKISARFGHDTRKLVRHYQKLEKEFAGRLLSSAVKS